MQECFSFHAQFFSFSFCRNKENAQVRNRTRDLSTTTPIVKELNHSATGKRLTVYQSEELAS